MSLDTVVEDITDEAEERREELLDEADERADEIVAEAEADAEEIREEANRSVEDTIAQEREQKLSSAKLTAKQERLEARRDVLSEVRDRVESRLESLSGGARETLTRELVENAAEEFDEGESVSVRASAEDADLVESILEEYDGYEFAGAYDCLGGVVAQSETSRVRVNNTFDSVLEDVWEDELKNVSEILFGER